MKISTSFLTISLIRNDEPWNENDGRKEILMHEQMNDTSIA